MALFNFKSFNLLPDFKVSSVLSIPTQLAANAIITTTNTVNTVLDIASPIGLAGNALLGKPFQDIHQLGDQVIEGVSDVVTNVGIALGATIKPNDTHHKNEWEDKELTLDGILNIPKDLLGNTLIGTTNIVNDVLNAVAPIGLAGNALIPGFDIVHQAGDSVIHAVSETVYDLGSTLGGNIQPNETHNELEWSQPSPSATEDLKSLVNNVSDRLNELSAPITDHLTTLSTSPVITQSQQLLGNALVTTSNTLNTVLDVVSPIGLAGNALLGAPFEAVHELGDRIIDAASNVLSGAGTALGATVEVNDTHHQNEWEDGELTLNSLLDIPRDLVENLVQAPSDIANDVIDSFAPIKEGIQQTGNTVIHQLTEALVGVGTALQLPIDPRLSNPFNQPKEPNNSTTSHDARPKFVHVDDQYSYRVSESAFVQVQALYHQYSATGSLKGKNFWRPIYSVIREDLASNDAVDQGTKNWLKVAEAVATADPQNFLYQFVRLGTGKALGDRKSVV